MDIDLNSSVQGAIQTPHRGYIRGSKKKNWEIALIVKQYQKICLMVKFIICWKIKFTREVMETSQIG